MKTKGSLMAWTWVACAMLIGAAPAQTTVIPAGANVLNVKLPPYNAAGDGIADDTTAIQAALSAEFAYELGNAGANNGDYPRPKIVYLPAGTYKVSNTLAWRNGYYDGNTSLKGQGPGATVIKLADNAAAFGNNAAPKAVARTREGNQSFHQYVTDLTIDTGSGNPGAIALDFIANNRGAVRDVVLRSGDGFGFCGLEMMRAWPGPAMIKNVTVIGFDYGIRCGNGEYSMTYEDITLTGQKIVGFLSNGNEDCVRRLVSNNTVPAFRVAWSGHLVLLDATFHGGAAGAGAIEVSLANGTPYVYARNISAAGSAYDSAVKYNGAIVPGLVHAGEWKSAAPFSQFPSPAQSLNLPVEETPNFTSAALADWALAATSADIPAALASGKPIVYFPRGFVQDYNGTFSVPAHVRKIIGFEMSNRGTLVFRVEADSAQPLIFEGFQGVKIEHRGPRTVACVSTSFSYEDFPGAGKFFCEDVETAAVDLRYATKFFARQLNIEGPQVKLLNRRSDAWVLGFKTEGVWQVVYNAGSGRTEVLGGLLYPAQSFSAATLQVPAFFNNEGSLSVIYSGSSYVANGFYAIQVRDIRGGVIRDQTALPGRTMPLFNGYQAGGPTGTSQPQLTPGTGNFTDTITVSAAGDTAGSVLRFTTDGSTPTAASALYSAPLVFSATTTLKVRAFAAGFTPSAVAVATFTKLPLLPPQPSIAASGAAYQYYEGTWNMLPNFTALTPLKTGTQPGFALTPKNRADFYCFRFTGSFWAPTDGLYAFSTGSDDGSALYIDGQRVVNNDGLHGYTTVSGEVGLAAGQHQIVVTFFDYNGDDYLDIGWRPPGAGSFSAIPAAALTLRLPENPHGTVAGLDYRYVEGSGNFVAEVPPLATVRRGTVAFFDNSPRLRNDFIGFDFTGYLDIPTGGEWTFFTQSDDGSKLYLGTDEIVNNDGPHGMVEQSGTRYLAPGRHAIRVLCTQGNGGYGLNVLWQGPGVAKAVIPAASLRRQPPFAQWQQANFTPAELTNPALSGDPADFDFDGLSNLLEYLLASAPKNPSVSAAPSATLLSVSGSRYLHLTFRRNKSATDATLTPEVSSDLVTWNSGPGYLAAVSIVDNGATETVTVRDLISLDSGTRRFIRVRPRREP